MTDYSDTFEGRGYTSDMWFVVWDDVNGNAHTHIVKSPFLMCRIARDDGSRNPHFMSAEYPDGNTIVSLKRLWPLDSLPEDVQKAVIELNVLRCDGKAETLQAFLLNELKAYRKEREGI